MLRSGTRIAIWESVQPTLAKEHALSRQRIKQIIAREEQKRQLALSVLPPEARMPS